eukprot:TRINITY_DN15471_c0_g1_i1.p1 TRINITY_DN15471_c0_g1~~TRINITY_DN15471_c0_g1_i1.p1  ORF type:complete len:427 (-),score=70.62 TRINITY_DN15471_c0_g1_i1:78-1271(-)
MDAAQQAILELALNVGFDHVHAALCCYANYEDVGQHKRLELQKASMSDHEFTVAKVKVLINAAIRFFGSNLGLHAFWIPRLKEGTLPYFVQRVRFEKASQEFNKSEKLEVVKINSFKYPKMVPYRKIGKNRSKSDGYGYCFGVETNHMYFFEPDFQYKAQTDFVMDYMKKNGATWDSPFGSTVYSVITTSSYKNATLPLDKHLLRPTTVYLIEKTQDTYDIMIRYSGAGLHTLDAMLSTSKRTDTRLVSVAYWIVNLLADFTKNSGCNIFPASTSAFWVVDQSSTRYGPLALLPGEYARPPGIASTYAGRSDEEMSLEMELSFSTLEDYFELLVDDTCPLFSEIPLWVASISRTDHGASTVENLSRRIYALIESNGINLDVVAAEIIRDAQAALPKV